VEEYRVRFHSELRASTYILFCEFVNDAAPSAISNIDFQSHNEVCERLVSAGFEWRDISCDGVFGHWHVVTGEQLRQLGFVKV
jgi:hypothetical protein